MQQLLDELLEGLVVYQRKRVVERAQLLDPRLTEDDVLQPHDVAVLRLDPLWNYEDGVLSGYLSAQIAIRSKLRSV